MIVEPHSTSRKSLLKSQCQVVALLVRAHEVIE
jgi:hypothetical protein